MRRITLVTALLALVAGPAFAHVGASSTVSFAVGVAHPLTGIDHLVVMLAVGLWAALKGGRALWVWPATFVGMMLVGAALGMARVSLPYVEPGVRLIRQSDIESFVHIMINGIRPGRPQQQR